MPLRRYVVAACVGLAMSWAGSALAQSGGEWRPTLPVQRGEQTQERGAPVDTPMLRQLGENAASPAATAGTGQPSVRLGSVLIETAPTIDHAMFDAVIQPYLGQAASSQELAKLAQQIADVARANGLLLARAFVPAQQVEMGIVKIVLEAGQIDEVRIEGSSNRALRELLDPLVGKMAIRAELERRLTLAGDLPQIVVRQTELLHDGGRQILIVRVAERKKLGGKVIADNYGSENIGPLRVRLSFDAVALLDDSDFANVTFRTNPAAPKELAAASLTYGIALNATGTRAEMSGALSKSKIELPGQIGLRDISSQYAALAISHPVLRSRKANLWAEGQLEYLKVDQTVFDAPLQSDVVVTLSAGLSSSVKLGGGWLRTGVQLRQGLGVLGATRAGDPLASRNDADGQFTLARAWLNWAGKPVGDMTLRLAVSGQLASEPLLASEEIGIGGSFVGRAFDFYERSGDQGMLGMVELGYEFTPRSTWLKRIQPYVFLDGGAVRNLRGGFGGGTLISTGGGIRGDIGPIGLQLEAAVPVYSTGMIPVSNDPKVNLQVGLDF